MAEKSAPTQTPDSGQPPGRGGGFFQVHKPGEGYATRLGAFVVALSFIFFSCHHWFYGWTFLRNFALRILGGIKLDFLLRWSEDPDVSKHISTIGAIAVFALGGLVAYFYIYVNARSAEFLVKTDGELAKVTWPKMVPWFKPDTQVWGATYVVLIVVVALTLYVFGVDSAFNYLAQKLFYGG